MIPSKEENPNGLHASYVVYKIDGTAIDDNPEYFVLRLDNGGEPEHVAASRKAVMEYAREIEPFLPKLADDLRNRYGKAKP